MKGQTPPWFTMLHAKSDQDGKSTQYISANEDMDLKNPAQAIRQTNNKMCTQLTKTVLWMICSVYKKDGMLDYFKQLLMRQHTYEDEELRSLVKVAVHTNANTGGSWNLNCKIGSDKSSRIKDPWAMFLSPSLLVNISRYFFTLMAVLPSICNHQMQFKKTYI